MSDILDRIITVKRDEIRVAQESVSLEELRLQASTRDSRDFVGALRAKHAAGKPAIIAEVISISSSVSHRPVTLRIPYHRVLGTSTG